MGTSSRRPPQAASSIWVWLRTNLFGSALNGAVSAVLITLVVSGAYVLLDWVFTGARWGQVWTNLRLFAVYRYPADLLWRPLIVAAILMLLLGLTAGVASRANAKIITGVFWWFTYLVFVLAAVALLFWPSVRFLWLLVAMTGLAGYVCGRLAPGLVRILPWMWGSSVIVGIILLSGFSSSGPLRGVDTRLWGGLTLTLILSAIGITVSFPLGIALALGRQSKLPVIRYFCIGFIEVVRGAPLITWLFIAAMLVPLIFAVSPDRISALARALVAISLFSAAYMAENIRGGLQAVPKGQAEAAQSLGLSVWHTTILIILPQALRSVIPAIVGQAISLFKDTSLVFVIGLYDVFNVSNIVANQTDSLLVPGGIRLELSLFLAVVYWYFAYRMSIAARQLEAQLGVGER